MKSKRHLLQLNVNSVFCGELCVIDFKDISNLYNTLWETSIKENSKINTVVLEAKGESLMEGNLASRACVRRFFLDSVEWIGQAGNRVSKELRKSDEIVDAIIKAGRHLKENNIKCAIEAMTNTAGVGISIGSLVLHSLSPEKVGAYDTIIQEFLDYSETPEGYVEYCNDLKAISIILNKLGIKNPKREEIGGKWLPADISAVLFYQFEPLYTQSKKP